MKRLIYILLVLFSLAAISYAGTPSYRLVKNGFETINSGDSVLITLPQISLAGDSLSFIIEYSIDSSTTRITYLYVSPEGLTEKAYKDADELGIYTNILTRAVFTEVVPRKASTPLASFFFTITNNKQSTELVGYKIYLVTWR